MKYYLIISSIFILTQIQLFGQETNSKSFWANSRVELSGTYGLSGDIGLILKGKKEIFNSKHFEGLLGVAFQYSYWAETDKYVTGII